MCVNCDKGAPGYPASHLPNCPRPKYHGQPDADSPLRKEWEPGDDHGTTTTPIYDGCGGDS